ncbi:MAG TPA: FtsX-like permease family protein [Solirubrobacteraceae bacterium]
MNDYTLRNLVVRRRRAVMTALAVLLGVSLISGTYIFTDNIHAAFGELFGDATRGTAVIVSSRQDLAATNNAPAKTHARLIGEIQSLPGVAGAEGEISNVATIVGRNGKPIENTYAPTLGLSYVPPQFGRFTFVAGRPPTGPGEVAIDQSTAQSQGFRVGDMISILTDEPLQRFRITGIARLGGASLGGATFAVFSLATAQALYLEQGRVDQIAVTATKGTSTAILISEIRPLLSPELVVRSAQSQAAAEAAGIADRLGVLIDGLLAFGFIAVFLGAFAIFNTFSMTIAERTGEFALLRALGATRRQVLDTVLLEATAIGLAASILGLLGGFVAAILIRTLFEAIGLSIPSAGLTFRLHTVVVGVGVGLLVTIGAALAPALRATRVAPLQAIRDVVPRAPSARTVLLRAGAALALFAAGLVLALTGSGSAAHRLTRSAIGAGAIVLAIVVVSPIVIGQMVRLVGWPLERGGRILGRLARENTTRNSTRTAATASSLMIGLALVLFVTVYANGLRTSTTRIVHRTLLADFTLQSRDGTSPIPPATVQAVTRLPELQSVASVANAQGRLGSSGLVTAEGVDPTTFGQVYRFDWVQGSDAALANLGPGDVLVEQDTARSAHLSVGGHVLMKTETGLQSTLTVRGIYRDQALLQGFVLPSAVFARIFHQPRLQAVFVKLSPGTSVSGAGVTLDQALRPFPGVVARSRQQVETVVGSRLNSVLALFYALLALVVGMSLLGIVNTLSLSLHERTRELGMLRALGMTPEQTRALIRDESFITAALGAIVGVVLGILLAWIVTLALAGDGVVFAIPVLQVLGLLALGLLAGVVASVLPARRAVRIDVLQAIAQQ